MSLRYKLLGIPVTRDELVDYAKRTGIEEITVELETRCTIKWGIEWAENNFLLSAGDKKIREKVYARPTGNCSIAPPQWINYCPDSGPWISPIDSLLELYISLGRQGFSVTIDGKNSRGIEAKLRGAVGVILKT